MKLYNVLNGTFYDDRTHAVVANVLERARLGGYRIHIHYGHVGDVDCMGSPCEKGRDWLEKSGVEGRVGRSCGRIKIPLMIHNSRCVGGHCILDDCILRITRSIGRDGRDVLYQSPDWKRPELRLKRLAEGLDFSWEVERMETVSPGIVRGDPQARFRTKLAAERYINRFTE